MRLTLTEGVQTTRYLVDEELQSYQALVLVVEML